MPELTIALDCPFCRPEAKRLIFRARSVIALWDAYPVTEGHALVIPLRHVASWFNATRDEQLEIIQAIDQVKAEIECRHAPAGYNIGMNIGKTAGQTVPHLHVHVIPRYPGDLPDPRGGVRHVIPARGNYLKPTAPPVSDAGELGLGSALIQGGIEDPLLPHLLEQLNGATAVDIAAAFVLESGVRLVQEHLQDLLDRGGRLRILTGDYFGVTEPEALRHLMDLDEGQGSTHLRIFQTTGLSFHPKAYLFRRPEDDGIAFVGSSNLSKTALQQGVEWNYRVVRSTDRQGFLDVVEGFDALWGHERNHDLSHEWIDGYQARRTRAAPMDVGVPAEPITAPVPHSIQIEALDALKKTREAGNSAGLVVLATGLGKTWLSAFDSRGHRKVLFVAHREEILRQAMGTFRRIRPMAKLGYYTGQERTPDADVLFASIQTLSRQEHLHVFEPDAFDYVVVDEFHHAAAATYRRVIGHFAPRFLLGLTATPERTDGADLLALCGDNLVYRADMPEGIRRGLLSPFNYFGVPDAVNYENIPWRSTRFDEEALTLAVATQERAENALEQLERRGQSRTIAFCVSQRHADFMAEYFRKAGRRAEAVHSGENTAPRALSLERLEAGELDIVCAVDMFNEGVDLPQVDTILMLRPTESRVLWLQQFGRGLRQRENKTLHVIDYIGNHRIFLTKIKAMFELGNSHREVAFMLEQIQAGTAEMPPGCSVTYDLEVIEILRGLIRTSSNVVEQLEQFYGEHKATHGVRPLGREVHFEGYNLRSVRRSGHDSWLDFVRVMGDLSEEEEEACRRLGAFFREIESTAMTMSYKMLVLMAMLDADALPGKISLEQLTEQFAVIARRHAVARNEVGARLDNPAALSQMLRQNPINAWTRRKGPDGQPYFRFDGRELSSTFSIPDHLRTTAHELLSELVEWRLAEYMDRGGKQKEAAEFLCSVEQDGASPEQDAGTRRVALRLPDREKAPDLPHGWREINVEGEVLHALFEEKVIRIVSQDGEAANFLPSLVADWFGQSRGGGTPFPSDARVLFRSEGDVYVPKPVDSGFAASDGPIPWAKYNRAEAMEAVKIEPVGREMQTGIIKRPGRLVFFVTLDKKGHAEEFQYQDRFVSPELFSWESQNRNTQAGTIGQAIRGQQTGDTTVELFVRRRAKTRGVSEPFYYAGELQFEWWEGEKPIKVSWKLRTPVPPSLKKELGVMGE